MTTNILSFREQQEYKDFIAQQFEANLFDGCKTPEDVISVLKDILPIQLKHKKITKLDDYMIEYAVDYVLERI